MELEGKMILDLGFTSGTSKAGNAWKKREIVVETFGSYPRKVKITLFGQRADEINPQLGLSYSFSVDAESREFNGRWYTDITAYAARELAAPGTSSMQAPAAAPVAPAAPGGTEFVQQTTTTTFASDPFAQGEESDDLPF